MSVAMSWGAFSSSILIQRRLDRRVGTYPTTQHNIQQKHMTPEVQRLFQTTVVSGCGVLRGVRAVVW